MRFPFRMPAAILAGCLALPALAHAQAEPPAGEAPKAEDKPAEPAPAPEPAKPEPKPEKTKPNKDLDLTAPSGDVYGVTEEAVPLGGRLDWAKRRDIRVIQKREVLKEARHALTLQTGVVPNDDFFVYPLVGVGYQYFFSEDLALDLHGLYAFEINTSLKDTLQQRYEDGGPNLGVRLPQALRGYATAGVNWYLLHGKLGFFSTRLTEFDVSFNFGIGAVDTKLTNINGVANNNIDPGGEVGAELLFYLSNAWAVRMGYRQNFYPANGGGVSYPISTTLAVTYFTAAPQ